MISLSADKQNMRMRGTKVVKRPVGETFGICWKKKTQHIICRQIERKHHDNGSVYNFFELIVFFNYFENVFWHQPVKNRIDAKHEMTKSKKASFMMNFQQQWKN